MRAIVLLSLIVAATAVEASDPRAVIAILDAEYQVKQHGRPRLPVTVQEAEPEAVEPIQKPHAVLITANFPCAPCEVWKSRLKELPLDVEVRVQATSPNGLFPCLWYPEKSTATGWSYYSKSFDYFLVNYDPETQVLK